MNARLLLAALFAAAPASAADLSLVIPSGIDLHQQAPTTAADADLRVFGTRIEARYGIRLANGDQPFTNAIPIVFEEWIVAIDSRGAEYRIWVHSLFDDKLVLELASEVEKDALHPSRFEGNFRVESYSIDGVTTDALYPNFQLGEDGTFRVGMSTGRWHGGVRTVLLDGHYAAWGAGTLSENGSTLTFRFDRRSTEFVVTMKRIPKPAMAVAKR